MPARLLVSLSISRRISLSDSVFMFSLLRRASSAFFCSSSDNMASSERPSYDDRSPFNSLLMLVNFCFSSWFFSYTFFEILLYMVVSVMSSRILARSFLSAVRNSSKPPCLSIIACVKRLKSIPVMRATSLTVSLCFVVMGIPIVLPGS